MPSPSLALLTDTQADTPGSPFFPSPLYLHSPQPSPISPLIVQSPNVDADFFWPFEAIAFPPKSDLGEISAYFLDDDVVDRYTVGPGYRFK